MTGQDAQFLSGGSFPIPVSQENGRIGIEFKDFGVKLVFKPLVLDSGRINLKLNISVSELVEHELDRAGAHRHDLACSRFRR